MLSSQSQNFVNKADGQDDVRIIPKLTLFGHSARIWDCYVSNSVSWPNFFFFVSVTFLLSFKVEKCFINPTKELQ